MPTPAQNQQGVIDYFMKVIQDQDFSLMGRMLGYGYTFNGHPNTPADNQAWIQSLHKKFGAFTVTIVAIFATGNNVGLHWRANVPAMNGQPAGYLTGINMITGDPVTGQAIANVQVGDMGLHPGTEPIPDIGG